MNGVYRDAETGWYCIEGGATLWDAYTRLYRLYGVTIPAGSCYGVGAGGHIVGGGYGLLSRLHGLTVDVLHAVEVVVVRNGRAEIVTVSRDSADPDDELLMWGHLGAGGGNFGVVTKYFFRDPPRAPEVAYLQSVAWNWDDLTESSFGALIDNYGAFLAANSDPGSPYSGMFALLHLFQRKAGQITLTVQYAGDSPLLLDDFAGDIGAGLPASTTARVAHPVLGLPAPASDTVRGLPWLYATQTLNGIGANQRGKYKSAYMNKPFPDDQIAVMWDALGNPANPNPQALLQVDSYGCEINAVASDATAVPQRSSIMKLQYQTYWTQESDDDVNLDWIRRFYDAMYGPDGPLPGRTGSWTAATSTTPTSISSAGRSSTTRTHIRSCSRSSRPGIRATSSTTSSRSSCRTTADGSRRGYRPGQCPDPACVTSSTTPAGCAPATGRAPPIRGRGTSTAACPATGQARSPRRRGSRSTSGSTGCS